MERGFICVEVCNCEDLFEVGSEAKLKLVCKLRVEGKDYVVQDGDCINVRFNVKGYLLIKDYTYLASKNGSK